MGEIHSIRINARIGAEHAAKVQALCEREGISRTDLLRRAIDHYYQSLMVEKPTAREILSGSGVVGCGEGPADLASQSEAYLSEHLQHQHNGDR